MIEDGIKSLHEKLVNKEITSDELVKKSIEACHSIQDKTNAFVTIIDDAKGQKVTKDLLSGIPYGIKDIFATKGILSTGSSNTLKDYVPIYTATCVANLEKHGAVGVAKTVLDELGMGGTGTTGHTGVVHNPWDYERMAAGSSAGSAASVAAGVYPFALGSDTGDSVRKPAAYTGVVGFKPTYGRISRYGMFPFASSLDHVGIFARNVKDIATVTDVLKGRDDKDMVTLPDENINYSENLDSSLKDVKLFYIKEVIESTSKDNEVIVNFKKLVEDLRSKGASVSEVSFDKTLLEVIYPTYFIISCAEATSNNSNLTGFIFGPRSEGATPDEVMINTRSEGFAEMIKRRFVIGSYILEKENQEKLFLNAKRIRNMIVIKMNQLFKEYDGLLLPASGSIAPKIEDSSKPDRLGSEYLILENHLAIGNFGGYPSITIPSGFVNNMPIAVNLTCAQKEDLKTLQIANNIEKVIGGDK